MRFLFTGRRYCHAVGAGFQPAPPLGMPGSMMVIENDWHRDRVSEIEIG